LFRRCLFFYQKACFEGSDGIIMELQHVAIPSSYVRVCFHDDLHDMNT
jgi:hypothetical protein